MKFLISTTEDGIALTGLISRATPERLVVVHVHGYGGDFYSNAFVRMCHVMYPQTGVTFVSTELRTTAYVIESYSEAAVRYLGSALADHDEVALDVDAVLDAIAVDDERVVLQGHSFGTNVVRRYAHTRPGLAGLIFLSPADSLGLYLAWLNRHETVAELDADIPPNSLMWESFGIATSGGTYPIPISPVALRRLLCSETFGQWSTDTAPVLHDALIVRGDVDPISNFGALDDARSVLGGVPGGTLETVHGAGHGFAGFEEEMCTRATRWLGRR